MINFNKVTYLTCRGMVLSINIIVKRSNLSKTDIFSYTGISKIKYWS